MAGYLFGGNTGVSYNDLQRRREIADALSKQIMGDTPKTTAQGIGALMKGIGAGIGRYSASKGITEGTNSANSAYDSILGRIMGGAGSASAGNSASVSAGVIPMPGAASEVAATSPRTVDISGSKQTFIDSLLPAAIEQGKRTGVDPRIIVAQAAQETGWGKSAPGNNYFGIKSHGQSGGNSMMTTEYVNGQKVNVRDSFRGYESPEDSVRGYGDFITENKRYKPMREAQGLDAQLAALQASGYATDPNYSRSVGAIARSITLPNEVASLDASIGVPYQPSLTPQDPEAEAKRQEAMKQMIGGQPSAADAVGAMGSMQPSAYVDPMLRAPNAAPQQQAPVQVAQNGQFPRSPQAPSAPQAPSPTNPYQGVDPEMLKLLSNPFLDADKKEILQNIMQQQMQQSDPMRQLQMQKLQRDVTQPEYDIISGKDGSIFRADKRQGTVEQVYGGKPDTFRVLSPEEKAQFGLDPVQSYQIGADNKISKIGGEGTTVNIDQRAEGAFDKKLAENQATTFDTMATEGLNARADLGVINELDGLLQGQGGTLSGLSGALAKYGIGGEGIGDMQAAQALINKLVPSQRTPGSGSMSDRDVELFTRSLPSLWNTPGGNAKIIGVMRGLTEYKQQQGEIADQVLAGEMTRQEARRALRALPNPLGDFKAPQGASQSPRPPEPPRAPEAPQQAPEGVDPSIWQHMTPEEKSLWR